MLARYRVVSHIIEGSTQGNGLPSNSATAKRIDTFDLELETYRMLIASATDSAMRGRISATYEELYERKGSIRGIRLLDETSQDGTGPLVEAHYLTFTCPHCGTHEHLLHERWFAYASQAGIPILKKEAADDAEATCRTFADLPRAWMPFSPGQLIPIGALNGRVESPYGHYSPVEKFIAYMKQPRLPFEEDWHPLIQLTYGQFGSYWGVYACQHCEQPSYVTYLEPNDVSPMSHTINTSLSTGSIPVISLRQIRATVISNARAISIDFDPPVDGRIKNVTFELVRGFTTIDGFQLMKQNVHSVSELAAFPLGFSCDQLLSHLNTLMDERIHGAERATHLVAESRYNACKNSVEIEPGLSFVDLAIANRFQGYPADFYRNIFSKLERRGTIIAPFDILPIRYEDIDGAFNQSGLPQCKSIRKMAFQQPLLISYAQSSNQIPFEDPNILASLLSDEAALCVLEVLRRSRVNMTTFDYLKKAYGELETWKYLKSLIDSHESLEFLAYSGKQALLTSDVRAFIHSLRIDRAARFLSRLWTDGTSALEHGIFEEYSYEVDRLRLESTVKGFDFELPRTPFDLIVAGEELGNCLAKYTGLIDKRTTVVIISRAGKPEGAVEVEIDNKHVVQAAARFNETISQSPALNEAFTTWLREKDLCLKRAV